MAGMSILGVRIPRRSVLALSLLIGCDSGGQASKPEPTAQRPAAASSVPAASKPEAVRPKGGEDWNDANIKWLGFDEGLALAKAEGKPICLVFYTSWCPHCRNYSAVFHDPRVVEQARRFVMVRLDKDQNKPISARFAPDGEYIPRTYFLSPDGVLDEAIHAPRANYRYFYDEKNAEGLLGGMAQALAKRG